MRPCYDTRSCQIWYNESSCYIFTYMTSTVRACFASWYLMPWRHSTSQWQFIIQSPAAFCNNSTVLTHQFCLFCRRTAVHLAIGHSQQLQQNVELTSAFRLGRSFIHRLLLELKKLFCFDCNFLCSIFSYCNDILTTFGFASGVVRFYDTVRWSCSRNVTVPP